MTRTASAHSTRRDSHEAAGELASQIDAELGHPDALVVFISARHDFAAVLGHLSERFPSATIMGCSSAGEFSSHYQGEGSSTAFAISSSEMAFACSMARDISGQPESSAKALLAGFRGFNEGKFPFRSALVLNDALAGTADELVRMLNMQTGGKYKFFGGGAGDDAAFSRTHVFCGTEVASNAAVALEILSMKPVGVGVRHGWEAAGEPMRVTSSTGTAVGSLDAITTRDVFEDHARATGQIFDTDAPLGFFLHNIAGMKQADGYKLRVPLNIRSDGAVNFAAEIPEGAVVSIMSATSESSTTAAREATEDAIGQLKGLKPSGALMFDCVATRLRLGKEFGNEVNAVQRALGDVALAGCNTYGQVASAEGQFAGFHNCTAVVAVFPE
jgi:hypothetical protein